MFSRFSHSLVLKIIIVIVVVGVVAELGVWAYDYITHWAPYSTADIVYSVNTASSTSAWYEIHNGRITDYPMIATPSVVGIARGGGKTFLLGTLGPKSKAYSLFEYSTTTKKYLRIYVQSSGGTLSGLSVDSAGLYGATTLRSNATTTPLVAVINLSDGTVTTIDSGYEPVILGSVQSTNSAGGKAFVSNNGYMSVVYANVNTLKSKSFHAGIWSNSAKAYTSKSVFPQQNTLGSDGFTVLGFVEPANFTGETWELKTPAPFTISSLALYPQIKDAMIGFTKGELYGVTSVPADTKNPTISVQITMYGNQTDKTAASSVQIPLKAAGTNDPSFVGTISS